jgi:hypothetical protein
MKYVLGVDSARNNSGAQTGYIFLKAEGESPQSPDQSFAFHLGGFKGINNIITHKTSTFNGESLDIAANTQPVIHIRNRPSMLWHAGKKISEVHRIMMPNPTAKLMADEYFGSFIFDHIHR